MRNPFRAQVDLRDQAAVPSKPPSLPISVNGAPLSHQSEDARVRALERDR
jgi:hypothetical protein